MAADQRRGVGRWLRISCGLWAIVCLALLHSGRVAAQIRQVVLLPPDRDFGFFVGDIVVLQATIVSGPDTVLDRQSLPVPGPVSEAIELRKVDVTEQTQGDGYVTHVRATYQIFLTAQQVTQAEIPGYGLFFFHGPIRAAASVPPWLFHVSPLRMVFRAGTDLAELRASHLVSRLDEGPARLRLVASAAMALLALLTLAGLRGWLPGLRRARQKPFAAAVARMKRSARSEEALFRDLHGAFDATAGRHVFAGDLEKFFAVHKKFAELRDDISAFFTASAHLFFADGGEMQDPAFDLHALAKKLRRIERKW